MSVYLSFHSVKSVQISKIENLDDSFNRKIVLMDDKNNRVEMTLFSDIKDTLKTRCLK